MSSFGTKVLGQRAPPDWANAVEAALGGGYVAQGPTYVASLDGSTYKVRDGADGTVVYDDADADTLLQEVLTAMNAGDWLHLKAAVYTPIATTLTRTLSDIVISGSPGAILTWTGGASTCLKLGTTGTPTLNNHVIGLEFADSGTGTVALELEDVHISSVDRCQAAGFTTSALVLDGSWETTVKLCDFRNCDYLIDLRSDGAPVSNSVTIKENYLGAGAGNTCIRVGENPQGTRIYGNNLADAAYMIHVPTAGCDLLIIRDNYFESTVAVTYYIWLEADVASKATDVRITDNWWSGIDDASAIYIDYGDRVHIKGNAPRHGGGTSYFINTTANHGYIIDEGNWVAGGISANVVNDYTKYIRRGYQQFVTAHASQSLDLNGGATDFAMFHSETADYTICRICLLDTEGIAVNSAVVRVGKEADSSYFYTGEPTFGAGQWRAQSVTPLNRDYSAGDTITVGTVGDSGNVGEVLVVLELWANS